MALPLNSTPVTIVAGSDGAGQPQAVATDVNGSITINDYTGLANILMQILYELRALKYATIHATQAEIVNDEDFKAEQFAVDADRSLV